MLAAAEATPSSFPKSVVYNLAPVRFLYTVSTEDELVYGDELGTLSSPYRRHDQMVFALTKADQWDDKGSTATDFPHIERRNGRVLKNFLDDSLLQGRESGAGATPVYYICGPRSMIDDAVSHLKSKNVSDDLIRYEKWW
jgi:ferredoxin-NADP reductase